MDLHLTPAQLAEAFCEMDDEEQAQFIIEAARIAGDWGVHAQAIQWSKVGDHLRTCACSNDDARALVLAIADSLERGPVALEGRL